ncbi:MAG: hypothetical protein AAGP08_01155 [Pseudomonadota bacterium]
MLKFLVFIVILGGIGVAGYAYFGDLSPEVRRVTEPVSFDAR